MRQLIDVICSGCGHIERDRYIDLKNVNRHSCGQQFIRLRDHTTLPHAVVGDDIPGGVLIRHGICHANGRPKRYDSKTDIRKAAKAKGLSAGYDENKHLPPKDSDKSKITRRWT